MRKFLLGCLLVIALNAEVVDKIILVVNDEPITSYDLEKVISNNKLDRKTATEYLINSALIKSEIKKRGIEVDEYEVDSKLEELASRNKTSLYELKKYLIMQGKFDSFVTKIKDDLKKEKLFNAISYSKLKIDENDVKEYYNSHLSEFSHFKSMKAIEYSSQNPKYLEQIIKNPLANISVESKNVEINASKLPFSIMKMVNDTKVNNFTKIFRNIKNSYSVFYISKKSGSVTIPFEKAKNMIYNIIANKEKNRVIKSYFQDIRAKAQIDVIK